MEYFLFLGVFILIISVPLVFKAKGNTSYDFPHHLHYGDEINLDEYLSGKEYLNLYDDYTPWHSCHWLCKNEIYKIQDSSGCYWEAYSDDMLVPVDKKGIPLEFKGLIVTECKNKIEVDISFSRSREPRTYYITGNLHPSNPISLGEQTINEIIQNHGYDDELDFLESCIGGYEGEDFSVKCITPGFEDVLAEYCTIDHKINLFKHGDKLLDGRDLTTECWFKTYHILPLQNDDEEPGIELYQEDGMPYLWWVTEILPRKDGYKAFRDVYGNCFYVGKEKNIGICHIHNGVDVSNNPVTIEIDWDGYFKIENNA